MNPLWQNFCIGLLISLDLTKRNLEFFGEFYALATLGVKGLKDEVTRNITPPLLNGTLVHRRVTHSDLLEFTITRPLFLYIHLGATGSRDQLKKTNLSFEIVAR